MANKNIGGAFSKGQWANLFNGIRTQVFQFGNAVKGKGGVVVQRDGRLNTGGGKANTELALNVLRDPIVQAAFDRLLELVASLPVTVEAASDEELDVLAADSIRDLFVNRRAVFEATVETMALAKITGVAALENNYDKNRDGVIYVRSVTPIDTDRIIYYAYEGQRDFEFRLQTTYKPFEGEVPPKLKIVDYKYYSVYINNAYGMGVGSQLIDVVEYKERLLELWIRIAEQYSSPVKVASVPNEASEAEVDEFFQAFKKMSEGSVFVLPPEFELEVKDISKTGADSLLKTLIDYADEQIRALILGESITGKRSHNEPYARDKVAADIGMRKALSLASSIAGRLNETTVKWLTMFNHPNANPPTIKFQTTTDLDALASRLVSLNQLGLKLSEEWLAETFEVELDTTPIKGFGNKEIIFEEDSIS